MSIADSGGRIPLIVGAGPVGLAAAVFLARAGMRVRIIERRTHPSVESRALAVNPRTMEILEQTGVTARMLELGLRVLSGRFYIGDQIGADLRLDHLQHKYPFMLALSQATTERLLEEALVACGGAVERGIELMRCRNVSDGVEVELRRADGSKEQYVAPWLLGADGAHSAVRASLDLPFEGSSVAREWHLADVPLETDLEEACAHVFFLDGGRFVFCLRVVSDKNHPPAGAPLWRVIANVPDPVAHVKRASKAGEPTWQSRFRVEHRIAERLQSGRAFLAGDAAHIHSPMGARGMNLGIEDAWTFAKLLLPQSSSAEQARRLNADGMRYGEIRRAIDSGVVKQIERLTWIVRGESSITRFIRRAILPRVVKFDAVRRVMIRTLMGLDHPLP